MNKRADYGEVQYRPGSLGIRSRSRRSIASETIHNRINESDDTSEFKKELDSKRCNFRIDDRNKKKKLKKRLPGVSICQPLRAMTLA